MKEEQTTTIRKARISEFHSYQDHSQRLCKLGSSKMVRVRGRHPYWITGLDCRIVMNRIRFWQSKLGLGLDWITFLIRCRPLVRVRSVNFGKTRTLNFPELERRYTFCQNIIYFLIQLTIFIKKYCRLVKRVNLSRLLITLTNHNYVD